TDVFEWTEEGGYAPGGAGGKPDPVSELIELGVDDEWLEAVGYVEVGPEGERIDKKDYVTNWKKTIRKFGEDDPIIAKVKNDELLTDEEEQSLVAKLNSPKMYFNEENLRRAYKNPVGNLIDFVKEALGRLKIKSRDEQLEEIFRAWLVSRSLAPEQAEYLSLLKNRGIVTGKVMLDDLFSPPLSILNAAGIGLELFGEQGLMEIIEDINQNVFRKTL
ncbi:type I restriction-modification enzyme R subunit C-terminal domain-containing protein, partial [Thermodesulfobacteriota bacterium]